MMNKIKHALHKDRPSDTGSDTYDDATPTGTGSGSGTGTGAGTGSGMQRAEQTAASHVPGQHSSSRATGTGMGAETGTGTGAGGVSGVQRAEQTAASHLPGHHGSSGTGSGSGTGTGLGSASQSYQVGNPADLDNRRGDMSNIVGSTGNVPTGGTGSSVREALTAQYDKAPWKEAQEKTELAEHEVATAALEADRADQALSKAQKAQGVVNREAAEHDRLLSEAERQRGLVSNPGAIRSDLDNANNDLAMRQQEAERHNRALREAEMAAKAKQGEYDSLAPNVRKNQANLQGMAGEYDTAMQKRDAVYGDADRLRNIAAENERARDGLGSTIEELMAKLRMAEEEMVQRERAFLQSRDRHRDLHNKLRGLRGDLDSTNTAYERNASAANAAIESAHGWDDKTAALRNRLQEGEHEHNRLLQLIEKLKAELENLIAELENLRNRGQPNHQAIVDAEGLVSKHRSALRDAEARAKEAEARYRALIKEADAHKMRGKQAAGVAHDANDEYSNRLKEAELHGDRHVQLWNEAQEAGTTGSSNATSAFQKLQDKVQQFTHREA